MQFFIKIIIMFSLIFCSEDEKNVSRQGLQVLGGTISFMKEIGEDADENDSYFYFSPSYGKFLTNNFFLEGNCAIADVGGDFSNSFGVGLQLFSGNLYLGTELSTGMTLNLETGSSTKILSQIIEFDDFTYSIQVFKIGLLSQFNENIFLDYGIKYLKFNYDTYYDRDENILQTFVSAKYFW